MKNKVSKIGTKNVEVIGRFQLRVNREPKRFRMTNINAFVPFGKTLDDKMQFMTKSGLVDSLLIDKHLLVFNPDVNEIDAHNVGVLIQHPDVRLAGFSEQEERDLIQKNLKKSNPKFILTNVDKVEDVAFEEETKLIKLRSKLYSDEKPLTQEMLVWLCSNFGIAYKTEIKDPIRYRRFLTKKIDSYIQVNKENRQLFIEAIDNVKMTEMKYYINEMIELGYIKDQSGIYKVGDRPVGASIGKVIEYFEQNPTDFEHFKTEVIKING